MMKKMGKMGKGGMLKQAMKMFGKGDPEALAKGMDPAALKALQNQMPAAPGMPKGLTLPAGLSGIGKKK